MVSRVTDDLKILLAAEMDAQWVEYVQNAIDHIAKLEKDKTVLRNKWYETRNKLFELENQE